MVSYPATRSVCSICETFLMIWARSDLVIAVVGMELLLLTFDENGQEDVADDDADENGQDDEEMVVFFVK